MSSSAATLREGLQPAKRRYKVLKRCDQNDPEIKKEIQQLESDFPELLGLPAPTLSKETRATLEGGALVTAIENETSLATAASITGSERCSDQSNNKNIEEEQRQKQQELQRKMAEVQEALSKQHQQEKENQKVEEEEKNTSSSKSEVKPDQVKSQIQELQNMAKNLQHDNGSSISNTNIKTSDDPVADSSSTTKNNTSSSTSTSNPQNYLRGAMIALHAYDAFLASTFPATVRPVAFEWIFCAVAAFLSHILQTVNYSSSSSSTSTIRNHLNGTIMCDWHAIYIFNPLVWVALFGLMRFFTFDYPRFMNNSNKKNTNKEKPPMAILIPHLAACVCGSVARLILNEICVFTLYTIVGVILGGVGNKMAGKYCA